MKIKAEDIRLAYGTEAILKGVSMEAGNREFVGLIGPNGSGKSTLLKCVYRVLSPDDGAVFLDGKSLKEMNYKAAARSMGVVAQHNYYNFDFSVWEVVLMGRSPHKKAMERENIEDFRIVEEALKKVGMYHFRQRSFSTLSGGEQQRVSIARALAKNPKLLLCDEPTGALDYQTGKAILKLLQDMCRQKGMTVIVITHNSALTPMADRVIHIKNGTVSAMEMNEHPTPVEEIEW